eukprot:scaffold37662_cov59-Phaeocystis_antarctica.AAC.2
MKNDRAAFTLIVRVLSNNPCFMCTRALQITASPALLQLLIIRYPQLSVREHRPRGLHLLEPLGRLRLVRGRGRVLGLK